MITFIVTETRKNYDAGGGHATKRKLERISGLPCLVQFYEDVRLKKIEDLGTKAVVFSGFGTPLWEHKLASFRGVYELVRKSDIPMIGFCGGHQLIAELWAGHNDKKLTKMSSYPVRKLRKGEPDPNGGYHPGYFKEWGFHSIKIVKRDPLFTGLRSGFMATEAHRCQVEKLPRDFTLLASTKDIKVQAYRHKTKTIYGTQFHPEAWIDAYPAGKRVIENFFKIAGIR